MLAGRPVPRDPGAPSLGPRWSLSQTLPPPPGGPTVRNDCTGWTRAPQVGLVLPSGLG